VSSARPASSYTFKQTPLTDPQRLRPLEVAHEALASDLSRDLSVFLRSSIVVTKASLESVLYSEFLQPFPEPSYVASLTTQPSEGLAVLALEMPVVFPIVDLLLGGEGAPGALARDLTEIEGEVLESVIRVICEELENACRPLLELMFSLDRREPRAGALRLMPAGERVLAFNFEVAMAERLGKFAVALSSLVSGRLLHKVSQEASPPSRRSDHEPRLRELLRDCGFSVEMQLPPTPIRGRDLLALRPGQTLDLHHRVDAPVPVSVAGEKVALAYPVRRGKLRAAMVDRWIPNSLNRNEELQ
jgi:flagellar motor switch protein FliM